MAQEMISHPSGTYKKIASRQSTSTSDTNPKALIVERGLTVFLGGAGMVGSYNDDMVAALKEVGIATPAYGNYSSLITGLDSYVPSLVDMLGDASAVALYNQDETDPVVFEYGELQKCRYGHEYIEKKYLFGLIKVRQYDKVECTPTSDLLAVKLGRDLKAIKSTDFSLVNIGISKPLPSAGQFNIIGYSWGAVIAARTAIFHARQGITVNHLVLIGAPINASLKAAVNNHPKILNTHIIDLVSQGDPIFAGMSDQQIVDAALKLANQMPTAEGHFYYSGDNPVGRERRRQLAKSLHTKGLR
ncbi:MULTISPECIES: thioesterase domain-containing protein [unclassified Pseudomonas]|uniref:thioesterase domain-containing protein n=1 Tax=unclassified Pseudomonas TaxID=196821 RepID=UPI00244BE9D1|nr:MULTISPECIES: thioesterase domain-containing protein [unclassified Pseudomonas]MDG9923388.1 thioesterase domain-containing protein [Pseudomonas sp. GD04045]MDH0035488.1 thioesterase domain-containing protein [Pseudomonas sp. GD04019]